MIVCFLNVCVSAKYGGGSGTANDPYQIWTAGQMNEIGLNEIHWDKYFKLIADINLAGFTGDQFNASPIFL